MIKKIEELRRDEHTGFLARVSSKHGVNINEGHIPLRIRFQSPTGYLTHFLITGKGVDCSNRTDGNGVKLLFYMSKTKRSTRQTVD